MALKFVLLVLALTASCHGLGYQTYAYKPVTYGRPGRPGILTPQMVTVPPQPTTTPADSGAVVVSNETPTGESSASPGGTATFVGQSTGGLFANSQGFGANIPIPPLGGSISVSGSTSLGIGQFVFPPNFGGSGSTAGGLGSGSVGPDGKPNSAAASNADAKPGGVAFGTGLGVAINLPVLGINQTFGQGIGIAVRNNEQ